ncbi:MAG: hypothetical protein ACE5II_04380, partial [Anaerolineae bacterium]
MAYDPDRFAFWHRWLQACIYDYHRVFTPQGTLRRSVRLGPIPREAVMEYGLAYLSRHVVGRGLSPHPTRASFRKAVRRAIAYVSKHRPRADAVIITPHALHILKVKRQPNEEDLAHLLNQAQLLPQTPGWQEHRDKPVLPILIAHRLDPQLAAQAHAQGAATHLAD